MEKTSSVTFLRGPGATEHAVQRRDAESRTSVVLDLEADVVVAWGCMRRLLGAVADTQAFAAVASLAEPLLERVPFPRGRGEIRLLSAIANEALALPEPRIDPGTRWHKAVEAAYGEALPELSDEARS